jgi:galactokinase
MSDSHTSCRDDYACSAADLDVLVQLCMDNGAYGAR